MRILITNDDGIFSNGLWALVKELKTFAQVVVVAPDREQSAIGTAVTLRQPLRMQRVTSVLPDVETYSVEGTPADSIILALSKLLEDKIDMVISGANQGFNLGDDVLISGTVGAALQGYLRGFPALAISVAAANSPYMANAARLAALLARRIDSNTLPANIFFNINLPDLPASEIKGLMITELAHKSHIVSVDEGHDGRREYYWLVRQKMNKNTDMGTDIWAIEQGNISITPLHSALYNRPSPTITDSLCSDLLEEFQRYQTEDEKEIAVKRAK